MMYTAGRSSCNIYIYISDPVSLRLWEYNKIIVHHTQFQPRYRVEVYCQALLSTECTRYLHDYTKYFEKKINFFLVKDLPKELFVLKDRYAKH